MAALLLTLGLLIVGASIAALLARALKQPLLLGYVAAGAVLGPAMTGIISDPEPVELLSELGIIFLMFIIGLELDLSKVKDVGKISVLIGTIQVAATALIAALLTVIFGFSLLAGLYLGLLIAFSSTIVVVKALADRNELQSLHGELVLGILVIQDVLAVLGLSLLGALGTSGGSPLTFPTILQALSAIGVVLPGGALVTIASLAISGVAFALTTWLLFFIVRNALRIIGVTNELLFVSTLAMVFLVSALAAFFQFSFAIGAFAAGIALSSSHSSHEIVGKVRPLKDFFLVLFFTSLGLQLVFSDLLGEFWLILFIIIGVLVLKPAITFFAVKLFGYHSRTAFLTAIHLAQVGEFGLILIATGVSAGVLEPSVLTAAVITTVLTMTLTAYLIKYDETFHHLAGPWIRRYDRIFGTRPEEKRTVPPKYAPDTVVFGVTHMTHETIEGMIARKRRLLLIDYNANHLKPYRARGVPVMCTDATNEELYEQVDFSHVTTVISAMRNRPDTVYGAELYGPHPNLFLLKVLRKRGVRASVIIIADDEEFARRLYQHGATLVLAQSVLKRKALSSMLNEDDAGLRKIGAEFRRELGRSFAGENRI